MKVTLPFPAPVLFPNRKAHWRALGKAKRTYREDCRRLSLGIGKFEASKVLVAITFNPPNRIRRDRDNMIAAFKAGQDGFADAIGVDDSKFEPTYRVGEPVKGGSVTIEITGVEA